MATENRLHSQENKSQAVAYFNENKVPDQLEKLLNDMFKEKPQDIYGYMAEFFGNISSPPSISKITCHEVLSSRGYPTVQLNLYCTIKGLSKLVVSLVIPYDVCPVSIRVKTPELKPKSPDTQPPASPSEINTSSQKMQVSDLVEKIVDTLAPEVVGADPCDQSNVDRVLMSLAEEISPVSSPSLEDNRVEEQQHSGLNSGKHSSVSKKSAGLGKKPSGIVDKKGKDSATQLIPDMEEEIVRRDYATLGVSMVTVAAAAKLRLCSLYEHLTSLTLNQEQNHYTMPIPAMTLLTSGKFAAGKQNLIKEVLILPKPGVSIEKGLQQITEIFHKMGTILSQKMGPSAKCITDDGSYSPPFDKPEVVMDYVVEAINGCGFSPGTDVDIILNVAASELYDKDKLKYEVIFNTFKTLDDIINMYSEFLDRYPGIIGIIDGVRSQDRGGWIRLNQKLGEKCFVIGSELYKQNPKVLHCGVTDKLSSVVLLKTDQANTITELLEKTLLVRDQNGLLLLSDGAVKTSNSLIADLALSADARFIQLGGPTRIENIIKYRRLVEIECNLMQTNRIVQQHAHAFPTVNIQANEGQENIT